ncbi:DUF305 domain-containing protein [Streptomyces sp. NPDC090106]|uniref:DUF305 domain-containing protein n=1 Tax=Streptomyces sp. NPDC090106 TaxID=3365946 RepID=UPI003826F1F3
MSHTRTRRAAVLAAATVTAALVLTACAGEGSSPSGHNAQDVAFAQGMVPHHRQAVEMAGLAADRAGSAGVRDLAARIEKAQDPEIETMSGWLESWGEETSAGGSGHSGHSGTAGMPGMMDDAAMGELEKASGTAFDTLFLTLMTEHHEGAVAMAETERAKGEYAPATGLADDIVTGQTAEIAEMNQLLGKD